MSRSGQRYRCYTIGSQPTARHTNERLHDWGVGSKAQHRTARYPPPQWPSMAYLPSACLLVGGKAQAAVGVEMP